MADLVFNVEKGRFAADALLPLAADGLVLILLRSTGIETDAVLRDKTDFTALVSGATDEVTSGAMTNYVRKALTSVTVTVDQVNDRVDADAADVTYTALGGAANDSVAAAVIGYDNDTGAGTDTNIVPISKHDLVLTSDGSDVTITITNFARAS